MNEEVDFNNIEYKTENITIKGYYMLDSNSLNTIYVRKLAEKEAKKLIELGYHIYENPTIKIDKYN